MKNAKRIMSYARTSAARHGIAFNEKVVALGDLVKTISGYAKSSKSDIIIMGSRDDDGPRKEYFGVWQTVYFMNQIFLYL